MARTHIKAKILGLWWRIAYAALKVKWGDCDQPATPHRTIRIAHRLRPLKELEVLVHEALHAACWHIDEKTVEQFSRDVARAAWRMGWRKTGPSELD